MSARPSSFICPPTPDPEIDAPIDDWRNPGVWNGKSSLDG